jgi:hypothetical protein
MDSGFLLRWRVSMATDLVRDEHERRVGKNQSVFREVNEHENETNDNGLWLEFVCECADACQTPLELTPEEYEQVRRQSTHFIVIPGEDHVVPDVERVIEQRQRYWVVEKLGEAADVARHLDPRSRHDLR